METIQATTATAVVDVPTPPTTTVNQKQKKATTDVVDAVLNGNVDPSKSMLNPLQGNLPTIRANNLTTTLTTSRAAKDELSNTTMAMNTVKQDSENPAGIQPRLLSPGFGCLFDNLPGFCLTKI